jgi:hypothetical protein
MPAILTCELSVIYYNNDYNRVTEFNYIILDILTFFNIFIAKT